jgi:hypothetical protein
MRAAPHIAGPLAILLAVPLLAGCTPERPVVANAPDDTCAPLRVGFTPGPDRGEQTGQVIGAAWDSPCFSTEAGEVRLVLNSRYQVDFSAAEAATLKPVYRLREQIMSEVSHNIHSHGARPGIISFGKR